MDEAIIRMTDYKAAIRRRLPLAVFVTAILSLIVLGIAFGLPPIYRSRAVILIEQQDIPQDLVRSLVTSYADQRIQVIAQRVLTNANLQTIIEKFNLYEDERKRDPLERVLEQMRDDINIAPISADIIDQKSGKASKATIAFELSFDSKTPAFAQRVANDLVSLFLNENLKQRTEATEETLDFLTAESGRLRLKVAEFETKLADFKEANASSLPELTALNMQLLNGKEQDLVQIQNQLRSLDQQRVYLESELAQQQPTTALFSSRGERMLTSADRLKEAENEYISLSARYGAAHPDVVALRKEIASLKSELGKRTPASELIARRDSLAADLAVAEERYSSDHPDVKRLRRELDAVSEELSEAAEGGASETPEPDNPVYIQLKARLEATMTEIASLERQREALHGKIEQFETSLTAAPQVEREYRALTRDYENALANYQEVLAKKQEAEIARSLETEKKGERFTLIEPPITPEEPDRPNRAAIVLLGMLLATGGGVGAGVMAESLDERLYGRSGVARVVGIPPLAVIPVLENQASRHRRMRRRAVIVLGGLAVLFLVALLIHFLVGPLDVLYFRVLRVLNI